VSEPTCIHNVALWARCEQCEENNDVIAQGVADRDATIATLRAEIARLEKDAARFNWCQNNPKLAQAMFWNYQSRKQRAEAIDAAITAAKNGEVPTE
jgi:uncharacterized small protein (DUF1192 family)